MYNRKNKPAKPVASDPPEPAGVPPEHPFGHPDDLIPPLSDLTCCAHQHWLAGRWLHAEKQKLKHGEFENFKLQIAERYGKKPKLLNVSLAVYRGFGPKGEEKSKSSPIRACHDNVKGGKKLLRWEQQEEARATLPPPDGDMGILHGDCRDWLRDADAITGYLTDIPYGVGQKYDGWREPSTPGEYRDFLVPIWREMVRSLVPGGVILAFVSHNHFWRYGEWLELSRPPIASCFFRDGVRHLDYIVEYRKPGGTPRPHLTHWTIHGSNRKGLPASLVESRASSHPCPKDLPVCRELVERFFDVGSLVVDPFCGSGTIPLACQMTGRRWLGIDQSATYVAEARHRIAQAITPSIPSEK